MALWLNVVLTYVMLEYSFRNQTILCFARVAFSVCVRSSQLASTMLNCICTVFCLFRRCVYVQTFGVLR